MVWIESCSGFRVIILALMRRSLLMSSTWSTILYLSLPWGSFHTRHWRPSYFFHHLIVFLSAYYQKHTACFWRDFARRWHKVYFVLPLASHWIICADNVQSTHANEVIPPCSFSRSVNSGGRCSEWTLIGVPSRERVSKRIAWKRPRLGRSALHFITAAAVIILNYHDGTPVWCCPVKAQMGKYAAVWVDECSTSASRSSDGKQAALRSQGLTIQQQ